MPPTIPSLFFKCTALSGTNKTGILKPDTNGYFRMPIGALNVYNSSGQYYTVEGARELFEHSGALQRRIQDGCLKGEEGHPVKLPGQSDADYIRRCRTIHEPNVSHHIASVELDFNSVKDRNGQPVIAIIGEIAPSGTHGAALERSLMNPRENVCFSIRSFSSKAVVGGVVQFRLVEVITWDRVTEPGLNIARKYFAPTLESYVDHEIKKEVLQEAVLKPTMVTENGMLVTHESKDLEGRALLRKLGWELNSSNLPASMRW